MEIRDGARITIETTIDGDTSVTSRSTNKFMGFVPDISTILTLCLEDSGLPRVLEILARAIVKHDYPSEIEQEEDKFIEAAENHIKWWKEKDEKLKRELEKQAS